MGVNPDELSDEERKELRDKIRKEKLPEVWKHEQAMIKAGKIIPIEIRTEEPPPIRKQESYIYEIENLTANEYRFQFNALRVIFESNETKFVDISKEPSWKLGLKILPKQKDAKTDENIFRIEKVI